MNILFYMPSFRGGGAERIGVLLSNEFSRRGHRVCLAVDSADGPNREFVSDEVEVCALPAKSHVAQVSSLRAQIKAFRPDCLFGRLGLSPSKLIAASAGIVKLSKVAISYHNPYEPSAAVGGRTQWFLAPILSRLAGRTITVSSDVREELVRVFGACPERTVVIHNPVDIEWVREKSRQGGVPKPIANRKYVLSVGRLVEQKNFDVLVEAFAKISDRTTQDLVILGEGPLRCRIEERVRRLGLSHRVHLPGYIPNPFPVYRGADAFVLPSRYEGFGNVVVEALSLGVPVVATRCPGGPKEILENGKFGRLVDVDDKIGLAEAVYATLAQSHDRAQLQVRAAEFALERVAAKYLDAVMSV